MEECTNCNEKVPLKLRKISKHNNKHMLYETKCWAVKREQENKISDSEIKLV